MNGLNGHSNNIRNHDNSNNSETTEEGKYKREEIVRIAIQALQDLGYGRTAQLLEEESGFNLENPQVTQFRKGVMDGDWAMVESLIPVLELDQKKDVQKVQFLVKQQKFLELLEARDVAQALSVLRNELAPLSYDTARLHKLSSFLMCADANDLRKQSLWSGANRESRELLLVQLQNYISSSVMIPSHRLRSLFDQAVAYQRSNCLYHDSADTFVTLYADHQCDRTQFPGVTKHVFEGHLDEVWYVTFSHDGKYIASASKDKTTIIWSVERKCAVHVLEGHEERVCYLAWSPDDTMLLSCYNDGQVTLWNTKTGKCIRSFEGHTEVAACEWLPGNEHFVTGSCDKNMFLWDIHGHILHKWIGDRINGLAISNDGTRMVTICHDKKIHIYDMETRSEIDFITEDGDMTTVRLSDDGRYVIVNLGTIQEIHLWDIVEKKLVRQFVGFKQGRFIIRSCMGGHGQTYIASGSEDGSIYVWHRDHGALIETLVGHSATVNCVHWNPANPYMFASASDDHTIRL
ncbi:WD40 repeat-like protein [Basidiobolus meristosporus CBS 931.73]|uniref:WD40 repeat-like protein n=1 Tax=Basidiobolus meristosporus CBS 931.73 TaxID=1314790 RepID=A0A1Y1XWH4_9FUNG|nr:WD40 repeat-like protein [Basidiobolus meristosporus CBS 931.73]|eukprot:ORX90072.1 WD40 repeat-like protein [Basidiobolus meristosporus CBS 931.73]